MKPSLSPKFLISIAFLVMLAMTFQNCSVYSSEGRKLFDEQGLDVSTSSSSSSFTDRMPNTALGDHIYSDSSRSMQGRSCADCHGIDGQGNGPLCNGDCGSLVGVADYIIEIRVRNGGDGMPEYTKADISDQELEDLIAFINSF